MKNLKNFKNDNANINLKSPKILNQQNLLHNNFESINELNKNIIFDKSNSITNSNINTNPSTVYKSDSIKHNFQQALAKDIPAKYVKCFYI